MTRVYTLNYFSFYLISIVSAHTLGSQQHRGQLFVWLAQWHIADFLYPYSRFLIRSEWTKFCLKKLVKPNNRSLSSLQPHLDMYI